MSIKLIRRSAATIIIFALLFAMDVCPAQQLDAAGIDRHAVVKRNRMVFDHYDPKSPASVGNGEFAFTFDVTGLQTFPSEEAGHVPLGAMAQWSWHTFPERAKYKYDETLREYSVHGRSVSYATDMRSEAAQAIRANPHRFNLARLALRLTDRDGVRVDDPNDLEQPRQTISLWSGEAASEFKLDGQPVHVMTVAHPMLDAVAFSIDSPLIAEGRAAVEISFAYPAGVWGPVVDDWNRPERHTTVLTKHARGVLLTRTLDSTRYAVDIRTSGTCRETETPHTFLLEQSPDGRLQCVVHFVQDPAQPPATPTFASVRSASQFHWKQFWTTGGAIDLSASSDPRWRELERRIVLSQFQTAVNCAGSMPPQETGLVCNSWFGKSHLEMHWWHAAHFALWGRFELLERSLDWYDKILPAARRTAERQGYAGVRWPKMSGPNGVSSPSEVGELLIWQQPHPIYFAELAYQHDPSRETLERYQAIVEQTANFMADYAHLDRASDQYILGPVVIPAQECYDGRTPPGVLNPTYELAYWRWALQTANAWRRRLGLDPISHWADVADRIARPHVRDGVYTAIANPPFTRRRDHPSMLAALGVLPDVGLTDAAVMERTFDNVIHDWDWPETWGWDYPMMAMTAARLGRRGDAIDMLLRDTPKNHYLPNGHCRQADRLPIYLPANGGLLTAVAMMAVGWDGANAADVAPGFPQDGTWTVRHEGLVRMP